MNKNNIKLTSCLKKIEKAIPKSIYIYIRNSYNNIDRVKKYAYTAIGQVVLFPLNKKLKKQKKYLIPLPSTSIGDLLVFTSLENNLKIALKFKILHQNNAIFKNLKLENKYIKRNFFGNQTMQFLYASRHSNILGKSKKKISPEKRMHLRDSFFYKRKDAFDITKETKRNTKIVFSKEENKLFKNKFKNLLLNDYALTISENNYSGFSRVKNWGNKNMQKVIDKTKNNIDWIQVGMPYDTKLKNTISDSRGKTNLRELFYLASKARLILTTEGMLTHVSSAFNIPCISICSGFIYPEISEYENTISITPDPLPKCAYCLSSFCKYKYPICLKAIKPEVVIKQIKQILKRK
jgi:ADP-heptose:LPS heptosyltransferase